MEYENDPLLPILQEEIQNRTSAYQNLSAAEEQKLLMLNDAQKSAILAQDKSTKNGYLNAAPSITNGGVKAHDKFVAYAATISPAH